MEQTVKIKLLPTIGQQQQLTDISNEYIKTVNALVDDMVQAKKILKLSSEDVPVAMPSAVKNQAIRDAKSVYRKSKKIKRVPILKKPFCIWNNQNYKVKENVIEFPLYIDEKSKRIAVKAIITEYQQDLLIHKRGSSSNPKTKLMVIFFRKSLILIMFGFEGKLDVGSAFPFAFHKFHLYY